MVNSGLQIFCRVVLGQREKGYNSYNNIRTGVDSVPFSLTSGRFVLLWFVQRHTLFWPFIALTSTRKSCHHLVMSRPSGERVTRWMGFCSAALKWLIHRFMSGRISVLLVGKSFTHRRCCSAAVHFSDRDRIGRLGYDTPLYLWSWWRVFRVGRWASFSAT